MKSEFPAYFRMYRWQLNRFPSVPQGHWDNIENARSRMDEIGKKLNINHMEDWYKVTRNVLMSCGASTLYCKYKTMAKLFAAVYPEYPDHVIRWIIA